MSPRIFSLYSSTRRLSRTDPLLNINNCDIVTGNSASKMEELRRKREERKQQRQREFEARRNARGQGPMKLGTKITAPPF